LDDVQRRTYAANHKLIVEASRQLPWSTVPELTQRANELKEQSSDVDLPPGKLQPSTVRNHLEDLYDQKLVLINNMESINSRQYVLVESLAPPSYNLHRKVNSSLRNDRFASLDFRRAENVAVSDMMTKPEFSKGRDVVSGLWEREAVRFQEGLFGLETLVMYAAKLGHISSKIRSKSGFDMDALREGLKRSLGDLELFILSFAVDVPQLISYLSTPAGEKHATGILESHWGTIMKQARLSPFTYDPTLILKRDTSRFRAMLASSRFLKQSDSFQLPYELKMKLSKVDNSLSLRIPRRVVRGLGLGEGDKLSLSVVDNEIRMRKLRRMKN